MGCFVAHVVFGGGQGVGGIFDEGLEVLVGTFEPGEEGAQWEGGFGNCFLDQVDF